MKKTPNLYFVDEPIFIKFLTTELLLKKAILALEHSYKSKSYIERNNLVPVCISTADGLSECINYLLTVPS